MVAVRVSGVAPGSPISPQRLVLPGFGGGPSVGVDGAGSWAAQGSCSGGAAGPGFARERKGGKVGCGPQPWVLGQGYGLRLGPGAGLAQDCCGSTGWEPCMALQHCLQVLRGPKH